MKQGKFTDTPVKFDAITSHTQTSLKYYICTSAFSQTIQLTPAVKFVQMLQNLEGAPKLPRMTSYICHNLVIPKLSRVVQM